MIKKLKGIFNRPPKNFLVGRFFKEDRFFESDLFPKHWWEYVSVTNINNGIIYGFMFETDWSGDIRITPKIIIYGDAHWADRRIEISKTEFYKEFNKIKKEIQRLP